MAGNFAATVTVGLISGAVGSGVLDVAMQVEENIKAGEDFWRIDLSRTAQAAFWGGVYGAAGGAIFGGLGAGATALATKYAGACRALTLTAKGGIGVLSGVGIYHGVNDLLDGNLVLGLTEIVGGALGLRAAAQNGKFLLRGRHADRDGPER